MNIGKKLILAAAAVGGLFAAQAHAETVLTTGSVYYVGRVNDGVPAGTSFETTYVNSLIAQGTSTTQNCSLALSEICERSVNAVPAGQVTDGTQVEDDNGAGIALNGATYLLVKFGDAGDGQWSYVFYVANLNDTVTVSGLNAGYSHHTLYGGQTTRVPEPATLGLMGLGLLGIGGALRRRRKA